MCVVEVPLNWKKTETSPEGVVNGSNKAPRQLFRAEEEAQARLSALDRQLQAKEETQKDE